jgi:hypothetical protein
MYNKPNIVDKSTKYFGFFQILSFISYKYNYFNQNTSDDLIPIYFK